MLQELQLAVAGGDEDDAKTADRHGSPRMMDVAVVVGGEVFHWDLHLHVGPLALERAPERAAKKGGDRRLIIDTGDADVVDAGRVVRSAGRKAESGP